MKLYQILLLVIVSVSVAEGHKLFARHKSRRRHRGRSGSGQCLTSRVHYITQGENYVDPQTNSNTPPGGFLEIQSLDGKKRECDIIIDEKSPDKVKCDCINPTAAAVTIVDHICPGNVILPGILKAGNVEEDISILKDCVPSMFRTVHVQEGIGKYLKKAKFKCNSIKPLTKFCNCIVEFDEHAKKTPGVRHSLTFTTKTDKSRSFELFSYAHHNRRRLLTSGPDLDYNYHPGWGSGPGSGSGSGSGRRRLLESSGSGSGSGNGTGNGTAPMNQYKECSHGGRRRLLGRSRKGC